MPQIDVTFRERSHQHLSGHGPLEFGRNPNRGFVVLPRNPDLHRATHKLCGWFGWDEGWYLHRPDGTDHLIMQVTADGRSVPLRAGEQVRFGPGDGWLDMTITGKAGRESVRIDWSVNRATERREPVAAPGDTEEIEVHAATGLRASPYPGLRLSDTERAVIAAFAEPQLAGDPNAAALTSSDVAERLHGERDRAQVRAVDRALERVKAKVRRAQQDAGEEPLKERPGVKTSPILAEWLLRNEIVTEADVAELPRR